MLVKDLIAELIALDHDDIEVYFQYPSGDYWRTQLAGSVDELGVETVEWSEYHREYSLPRDPEKPVDKMDNPKQVIILK